MRLVGSDRGLKEVTINDSTPVQRSKDGTFHVDGPAARALVKSGDFAVAGTTFRNATGYRCQDCGFLSLFPKCKCGSTNTIEED
jgi:hypothetical protein